MANCVFCQGEMIITEPWQSSHPLCGPQFEEFGDGSNDPFSRMLKQQLTDIIRWADKESARSKQVKIGPSEIGDPCDRRIGYRIAEVPEVNDAFDPWAAIVGTAVHSWLDGAVQDWMAATGVPDWKTETTLSINNFIEGHSDLYSVSHAAVIDWKTAGPTVMKKVVKGGPSDGYILQTQIYGYGFERAGIPVNKVCLVFLPRAGRLQDMYVWSADYNREVAQGAIKRLYEIARRVVSLETSIHPHRWEQVPATPSNACGFCSWYNSMKNPDEGADERGCPGR